MRRRRTGMPAVPVYFILFSNLTLQSTSRRSLPPQCEEGNFLLVVHQRPAFGHATVTHQRDLWEQTWSRKIFTVIQQFNQDLTGLRQTEATQKKTQQKRAKVAQDGTSFDEATKENEGRIWQEALQRYAQQINSMSRNTLGTSNVHNVGGVTE